jgi:hypothetical protein
MDIAHGVSCPCEGSNESCRYCFGTGVRAPFAGYIGRKSAKTPDQANRAKPRTDEQPRPSKPVGAAASATTKPRRQVRCPLCTAVTAESSYAQHLRTDHPAHLLLLATKRFAGQTHVNCPVCRALIKSARWRNHAKKAHKTDLPQPSAPRPEPAAIPNTVPPEPLADHAADYLVFCKGCRRMIPPYATAAHADAHALPLESYLSSPLMCRHCGCLCKRAAMANHLQLRCLPTTPIAPMRLRRKTPKSVRGLRTPKTTGAGTLPPFVREGDPVLRRHSVDESAHLQSGAKRFAASDPESQKDATRLYAHRFREAGRFGSHPTHDNFDDESDP